MNQVVEKFLSYIKIDTQSAEKSNTFPSTLKQLDLARLLKDQLISLKLTDVFLDENGYVTATLPSNIEKKVPVIGLIAHIDTSPDLSGKDVKPKIFPDYDGSDLVLNEKHAIYLSPSEFPVLRNYIGQTLITTDGTTLLGADDKAGVAEIMTAVEYLVHHPEIKHGTVKIAFNPDEEIGRGTDRFDLKQFNADYAYTIDGGEIGELEYENFNAANAVLMFYGNNIHPGHAKKAMINSILMAYELHSLLPVHDRPEYTSDYEGFYHLNDILGNVEKTETTYLIRDHDRKKFEEKKEFLKKCIRFINTKYKPASVHLQMKDMYYNMKDRIEPVIQIVDIVKKAMISLDIIPKVTPIRGGTDGAQLSHLGLPCPNIFTGGHNPHGKYEFIPVESMVKAVEVIIKVLKLYTEV